MQVIALFSLAAMFFQIAMPVALANWENFDFDSVTEKQIKFSPKQVFSISATSTNETLTWENSSQILAHELPSNAPSSDFSNGNSAKLILKTSTSASEQSEPATVENSASASKEQTEVIKESPATNEKIKEDATINAYAGEIEPANLNSEPVVIPESSDDSVKENLPVEILNNLTDENSSSNSTGTQTTIEPSQETPAVQTPKATDPSVTDAKSETVIPETNTLEKILASTLELSDFVNSPDSDLIPDFEFLKSLKIKISATWSGSPNSEIKLLYLDDSQNWQIAGMLDLTQENSNEKNSGYFTFDLPMSLVKNLRNTSLRLEYSTTGISANDFTQQVFIDGVFMEATYQIPDEEISAEELADFKNRLLNPESFSSIDFNNETMDLGMPGDLSNPITIGTTKSLTQDKLAMVMVGSTTGNSAVRKGDSIVYENVFENTDVKYQILDTGLKEEIILKTLKHPKKFSYLLNLENFDYEQVSKNEIQLYKKGKLGQELYKLYTITAPKMTDASGNVSDQLVFKLKNSLLTLVPDAKWLSTAEYPVAVDPTVAISVLNVHSHPVEGEYWKVDFTTQGTADLNINPADQATIEDMQFTSLFCGSEDRTSGVQILTGDVLHYPNWNCNEVATVSHLDLRTADHHFIFNFGGATAEAFNAAYVWDGGGADANWTTALNWSSDVVPGSSDTVTINNTCASNCNPTINTTTSISGLVISSATTTVTQQDGKALTVNGNFTLSNGTFIGGTGTTTVSNGALTISGGTFTAPTQLTLTGNFIKSGGTFDEGTGTVLFYPPWGANISFEIDGASAGTETFYNLNFNNAADNSTIWIGTGDTIITTGTLSLTRGNINTGLLDARGNITQASTFTGGSATLFFNNDALSQTFTLSGGIGLNFKLDSAADASDSLILNTTSTLRSLEIASGFGANTVNTVYNGYGLTLSGGYTQANGTFTAPSVLTLGDYGTFTKTGGAFVEGTGTIIFSPTWAANNAFNIDGGSAGVETFYNVNFSGTDSNSIVTISTGDTLVVSGVLTLTNGSINTGNIDVRGDIIQASTFDGGSATIFFNNDALSQTYTLNGGSGPNFSFDSSGDSSDSLIFNSTSTLYGLSIASGFGANTANITYNGYGLTLYSGYTQAAGTFNAPNVLTFGDYGAFTKTGGTFNEGTGTVVFAPAWAAYNIFNIDGASAGSETFYNVNFSGTDSASGITISSGDTIVVTGTLTLTNGIVGTGNINAQGNVNVISTYDGGTSPLIFSGSADQNFNLTGATGVFNGDITINKSAGKVSLLSALLMDAASQDLLIQSGTLDLNGNNLTTNGSSGTLIVQSSGTLKLNGSESITANAGNPQLQASSTVEYAGGASYTLKDYAYSNLTISGAGTFTATTGPMTIGKNFYQTAGTFVASPATTTISGNFTRSGGSFTHNSGTVVLNGTNQIINGSTAFNNFTKSVSSADTLTLGAGNTTTIAGILTLGGASSNLLSLRSSSDNTYFFIDPQGSRNIQYLDVKDSYNSNALAINAVGTGSQSSGQNINWLFDSIISQSDYRFYANIDVLTPASSIGGLSATTTIYSTSSPVRLRVNLTVTANSLLALSQSFNLQVATSTLNWQNIDVSVGAASWWNPNWLSRKKITFNNSTSTENLVNFPVLVSVNSNNFDYSKTQNSGQDIRFVDPDGTSLNYEIEKWDETATSTVWVKVPQIDAASATDYIWMYYNNAYATGNSTTTGVWDNNFEMVQHLPNGTVLSATDSSKNNCGVSTLNSTSATTTNWGGGAGFNGSSNSIDFAACSALNNWTSQTLSLWVKPKPGMDMYSRLIEKGSNNEWTLVFNYVAGNNKLTVQQLGSTNALLTSTGIIADNSWHKIDLTIASNRVVTLFVDGYFNASSTSPTGPASTVGNIRLGQSGGGGNYYNGAVDEFRISSTTRSSSWVGAEYASMTGSMNSFGIEERAASDSWSYYNNPSVASNTTISALLLPSSNVGGSYTENNPTALNPNLVGVGQKVEWDFALLAANAAINEDYFFRIVKSDGTQLGSYNYAVIRYTADIISPTSGSLSISADSESTLTASISGASDSESGLAATPYIFYNNSNSTNSAATSSTSWISSGLSANTQYTFVASVRDVSGNVSTTSGANKYTLSNIPGTPATTTVATSSIALTWDSNSNPANTEYYVLNLTDNTNSGWITATSTTFNGLNPNTSYQFKVKARNGDNVETAYSSLSPVIYTLTNEPISLSTSSVTTTSINLSWNENGNSAGTEYYLKNITSNTNSGWITSTTSGFSGLTCATSYDFIVKSRNGHNIESNYSATTTQATSACPVTNPGNNGGGGGGGGGGTPGPITPPNPPKPPVVEELCGSVSYENFSACYFIGKNFEKLAATTTINKLDFNWKFGSPIDKVIPNDKFSAIWRGSFGFKQGSYTFTAAGDDGIRLYIDGILVIDKWRNQSIAKYEYKANLSEDNHLIELKYYEDTGRAQVNLSWKQNPPVNTIGALTFSRITQNTAMVNIIFSNTSLSSKTIITYTNQVNGNSVTAPLGKAALLTNLLPNTKYTISATVNDVSKKKTYKVSDKSFTTLPVIQPNVEIPIKIPTSTPLQTSDKGTQTGGGSGNSGNSQRDEILLTETPKTIKATETGGQIEAGKTQNVLEKSISAISDISGSIANSFTFTAKSFPESIKILQSKVSEKSKSVETVTKVSVAAVAPTTLAIQYALSTYGFSLSVTGASDIWYYVLRLIYALMSLLGLRAKRRLWGTVYDSKNKQPLDPALVELIDIKSGKIVDKAVTDLYGKFGFLDKPGEYVISVKKTNYSFPSKLISGQSDGVFENIYHGEKLIILKEAMLLTPNIPMDQMAFDWNQEDKKRIVNFNPKLETAVSCVLKILFWSGFAWVLFALVSKPDLANFSFLGLYILLILIKKLIPDTKLLGQVVSKNKDLSGIYLELSPVRIPSVVVGKAVTSTVGKFFLKASPGEYILRIKEIKGDKIDIISEKEVKIGGNGVYNKVVEI